MYQVSTFLDYIIKDLKQTCPELKSVAFFSDGAASQFEQRFLFESLTYFDDVYGIESSWSFFATSHGKGSVDGIGGLIKHQVFTACKTGAFILYAQSFATEAKKHTTKSKVMYVPATEVEARKENLDARWTDVRTLPNTHSTHCVVPVRKHVVSCAAYASSPTYQQFELVAAEPEAHAEPSTLKYDLKESAGPNAHLAEQSTEHHTPKGGEFILVEYLGKQKMGKSFKYVAQVINAHDEEYTIMHLHKGDSEGMMYVAKDHTDKYGIALQEQIVKILPTPTMDNRGKIPFLYSYPRSKVDKTVHM